MAQQAMGQHAMGQQAMGQQAMGQQAMGQQAMGQPPPAAGMRPWETGAGGAPASGQQQGDQYGAAAGQQGGQYAWPMQPVAVQAQYAMMVPGVRPPFPGAAPNASSGANAFPQQQGWPYGQAGSPAYQQAQSGAGYGSS